MMTQLDKEAIQKLVKLSRIECSEEEQAALLLDLANIITYIEQLQDVDTTGVPPCNHVLEGMANVFREDIVGETLSREDFLANAPSQIGGMIRVPPVIKSH